MPRTYIVTGTDTEIGKTVVSAMLTLALRACYWKAVQSGTQDGTDTKSVQEMTGLPDHHFIPESYVLSQPLSPHRSAELDGTEINLTNLSKIPDTDRPLIIEGAGGLMVPLTRQALLIDLFQKWNMAEEKAPLILVSRTGLGTINHTLLSIEALKTRSIPILGSGAINYDRYCSKIIM